MTPAELREARRKLGLGTPGLGKVLRINPRTVRRWEEGKHPIPGPVALVIGMMLKYQPKRDKCHNAPAE